MKRAALATLASGAAAAIALAVSSVAGWPSVGLGDAWAATSPGAGRVSGCDHDGVAGAVRTAFQPGVGYSVVGVTVSGIDPACAGHWLSVTLADEAADPAAEVGPTLIPPGGGSVTVVVQPVAVEAAEKVYTLIN